MITKILSTLIVVGAIMASVGRVGAEIINVNVGWDAGEAGWNDIHGYNAMTDGYVLADLVTSTGVGTLVDVRMVDAFSSGPVRNGIGGTTISSAFDPCSAIATQSNFYIYQQDADHTVQIRVEGLDPAQTYTFGFFDSYMPDNDPRRLCKYVIGLQSATLDPGFNIDNVATIANVTPDALGQVTIDLDFGADPGVSEHRVCGLAVMTIEGTFPKPAPPATVINVNFGIETGAAGWNDIFGYNVISDGYTLRNLVTSEDAETFVSIRMADAFSASPIRNGMGGATDSTAFDPCNALATKSNMYIYEQDPDHSVQLIVEGLNPYKKYKFGFFDSYLSDNNERRLGKYIIGVQSVTLQPGYNHNQVAYIHNVAPEIDGSVIIDLAFGGDPCNSSDRMCGLAVMTIEGEFPEALPRPVINVNFGIDSGIAGWNDIPGITGITNGSLISNLVDFRRHCHRRGRPHGRCVFLESDSQRDRRGYGQYGV